MNKLMKVLAFPFKIIILFLIWLYKIIISPIIPKNCRFYPTCSTYMMLAIKEWGVIKGVYLGVRRICRCRPRGGCGEDFVPLNIKGELKWIY